MFVKKVFELVKPFLTNLHSTRSQKYSEKAICPKLLQGSSIEEDKPHLCTLVLLINFQLANFLHFFRNQCKISILKFCEGHNHFFETLKPNSQETAENLKSGVFKSAFLFLHPYTHESFSLKTS
jgi:hypothetical protein